MGLRGHVPVSLTHLDMGWSGRRDWTSTVARAHSWAEFPPKAMSCQAVVRGEQAAGSAISSPDSCARPDQECSRSSRALKHKGIFLQKHPMRLSCAKSNTAQRRNSCAVHAKGEGMNGATMGLEHTHEAAGRACPWLQQ